MKYTPISMVRTSLTLGLAAVLLLHIPSAYAYLSPEQVFDSAGLTLTQPPPTAREADSVAQQQYQSTAAQRAAIQSSLPSTNDEPQDDFIPITESLGQSLLSDEGKFARRQERIDENTAKGGATIIIGGEGTVYDANGNVLHSGAPRVSATGPETTLAALAAIAAIAGTCAYLWYRQRRMQSILFS